MARIEKIGTDHANEEKLNGVIGFVNVENDAVY